MLQKNVFLLTESQLLIKINGAYSSTNVKTRNSATSRGRCVFMSAITFCIIVTPTLLIRSLKIVNVDLFLVAFSYQFLLISNTHESHLQHLDDRCLHYKANYLQNGVAPYYQ